MTKTLWTPQSTRRRHCTKASTRSLVCLIVFLPITMSGMSIDLLAFGFGLIRRHVRLLFRCWRTVTTAMIRGRRLVKHRTLVLLWENRADECSRQDAMRLACEEIAARHATIRAWRNWMHAFHARRLIKRVLWAYCEEPLRKAWRTWAFSEYELPKPRPPPSPRRLPPPVPVEPPSSAYKRRGSRLPRVPPHIVVPLMGLHSYALVHSPGTTARDRIEFRIHRAERIAKRFEHHLEEHKAAHPELALENTPVRNSEMFGVSRDASTSAVRRSSASAISSTRKLNRSHSASKPAPRPPKGSNIYGGMMGGGIGGGEVSSAGKGHVLKTPGRSASPQLSKPNASRTPLSGARGGIGSGPSGAVSKPPLSARKKLP